MSIADKISRLATAKTAIANAIKEKGVTVEDGDGFEDFATKINAITVGGLPSGISKFDFGTITVSSDTTGVGLITHKLGVIPDLVIVWAPSNIAKTGSMLAAIRGNQFGWRSSAYNNHMAYHGNSTTNVTWTNSNSAAYGIGDMTATYFRLTSAASSYYWRAGTYNYIAIKFS